MTQPMAAGLPGPATDTEPAGLAGEDPFEPLDEDLTEAKKRLPIGVWFAGGWLGAVVFSALFADFLPINDPNTEVASLPRLSPGQEGLILGADANRRDLFSRLIYGARTSMMIATASVMIGFFVGGTLGLISGYFRNGVSRALSSLFDILLAIPALVLTLALVAVLKGDPQDQGAGLPAETIIILALGLVSIPLLARITRANTLSWSQREFVTAARAQGARDSRIIFREVLPNVLPAMVYITLLGLGIAIVAEGGLALLGASVDAPTSTWGTMINDGRRDMEVAPFIMMIPVLAVFLTVMSMNYLSDVVRDRFDVRESAL